MGEITARAKSNRPFDWASARPHRPLPRGANNRVFRVEAGATRFAVKAYGERDDRGRLHREFGSLSFLSAHGVAEVPVPFACDPAMGLAAYEWIGGDRVTTHNRTDLLSSISFLARIDTLRTAKGSRELPLASDAAVGSAELWQQIDERYARLSEIAPVEPGLETFLAAFAEEAERRRTDRAEEDSMPLPHECQTLSPSDFGFHNALRRNNTLVFLDFEYFGWDDPVKLAIDFILHPGMNLSSGDVKEWLDGVTAIYGHDQDFSARLGRLYPVLTLKWCLIILNEFLPSAWARRVASGRHRLAEPVKAEQLAKAIALFERLVGGESINQLVPA